MAVIAIIGPGISGSYDLFQSSTGESGVPPQVGKFYRLILKDKIISSLARNLNEQRPHRSVFQSLLLWLLRHPGVQQWRDLRLLPLSPLFLLSLHPESFPPLPPLSEAFLYS